MSKIIEVTLRNENMVDAVFSPEEISGMGIAGISENVMLDAFGNTRSNVSCDRFYINLKPEANQILTGDFVAYGTLFNLYRDDPCITYVELKYEDGNVWEIAMPWGDDDEMANSMMNVNLQRDGSVNISIGYDIEDEDDMCDCNGCTCEEE